MLSNAAAMPPSHTRTSMTGNKAALGPDFSVNDFSKLTDKIRSHSQAAQHHGKGKNKPKQQWNAQPRTERPGLPQKADNPPEGQQRGKKRKRNGEVLSGKANGSTAATHGDDKSGDNMLQQEVFALGGTVDDVNLIEGVNSDSEVEGSGTIQASVGPEKGLQKGIMNILKEITIAEEAAKAKNKGADSDNRSESATEDELAAVNIPATMSQAGKGTLKSTLSFPARPDWFNAAKPYVDISKAPAYTMSHSALEQLHAYAKTLLDSENEAYKKTQQSSSSRNFYSTVIASGTLSDKISALTLAVQDSPVHNVKALETLVGLAKKRSRAQAVDVLRALKDLFAQGSLLPADRKLHNFNTQPFLIAAFANTRSWTTGDDLPRSIRQEHLICWAYESWLKETFFEVLKTLEVWCNDELEYSRSRAISYVYELLKEKPEQEANLLRMLVNKLGDPVKKLASQTSYLLMQLMAAHPAMKETIITSIEAELLFRPGQSLHAKYYAIVTLNQTALSQKEQSVAVKLLNVYFSLFSGLLKPVDQPKPSATRAPVRNGVHAKHSSTSKPSDSENAQEGELRDKLTSATLTGINRAYPYADSSGESLSTHLDALFKITHSANFNTSIQAMLLIQQLSSLHHAAFDRFYRTLYESLLDARLVGSSKQQMYLNLLYRSLKADVNVRRVKAFAKRIMQVLTLHQPSFICGAFFLLKELEKTFPGLGTIIDQAEERDNGEEDFQDVIEDGMNADRRRQLKGVPSKSESKNVYDGRKRDPEHSNAESSCLWELVPFLVHYHPSVAVSAEQLLRHVALPGKPDLSLHTLIHFLDRFVYRNPKPTSTGLRGSSIMQPMAASKSTSLLLGSSSAAHMQAAVNTNGFRHRKEADVAAEDVFFHKYFNGLGKEKPKKKLRVDTEANSDDEAEESEVWKAMIDSAPDLEGPAGSDEELEMADLESDFEQSIDGVSDGLDEEDSNDNDEMGLDFGGSEDFEEPAPLASELDGDLDEQEFNVTRPKPSHSSRDQRKKMKSLPTFASADDYAKLLGDNEDEDMG